MTVAYTISRIRPDAYGQIVYELVTAGLQRVAIAIPAKRTSGPEVTATIEHTLAHLAERPVPKQ